MQKMVILTTMLTAPLTAVGSCGASFCSLNTDWDAQGVNSQPGVRLDISVEYIRLATLGEGNHKTSAAGEVDEHDEVRTINRNLLATLNWNISDKWGITLKLPVVKRMHQHIYNENDGLGGIKPEVEKWDFSGVGDVQALVRYRFYQAKEEDAGIRFGVKLPTGNIHESNAVENAESSLQPGSGSLDTLLGADYHYRTGDTAWFAQGIWQQSINTRDHFKPGRKINADLGLSFNATPHLNLLLQLNLQHKSKDSGANAEPSDSGGYSVLLSPGLSYRVTPNSQLYGFVQKQIYQYVNGTQLTPNWSLAMGLSTQF